MPLALALVIASREQLGGFLFLLFHGIAGYVCYRERDNPIGGWLLYYYMLLYLLALNAVLQLAVFLYRYGSELKMLLLTGMGNIKDILLTGEADSTYFLSFILLVGTLVIFFTQVVVASILLRVKTQRMLTYLRAVLAASLAYFAIATFHRDYYLAVLIFQAVWLGYFLRSKRVRRAFLFSPPPEVKLVDPA